MTWLPLDVDDPEDATLVLGGLGVLDSLVHCVVGVPAGVLSQPFTEVNRADFERTVGLSAWSLVWLCRMLLPALSRSEAPRVVTLTSALGHRPGPNYHTLGVAKAALEASMRYLAIELGPRGVLCNGVGFSLVPTPGAIAVVGEVPCLRTVAHLAKRAPTGHATDAADVAELVSFLCSPAARNITGEVITADGGFSSLYF